MLPWLLLFFGYSTALQCYKGRFEVLSDGKPNFEKFYKLNCHTRRAACASWKTVHPHLTSYFYDCATRCRGRIACCRSDLCNDKWIEEYRNLTREVVEIAANPMAATANHSHLKVKVVASRIHMEWKKGKRLDGPQMKFLTVANSTGKTRGPRRTIHWAVIMFFMTISMILFIGTVTICLVTGELVTEPSTKEKSTENEA